MRRKVRRSKANALTLTKPMRSLVLKEINRTSETKERTIFATSMINFDGPISATDWYEMLPALTQGDSRENRDGAEITLVSLVIQGFIRGTPDGAAAGDALMSRLFVVSAKRSNFGVNTTDLSNNLLREGAAPRAFDGTLDHVYLPTNSAYVTAHYDKKQLFVTDHVTYVDGGSVGNSEDTRVAQKITVRPFRIALKVKGKVLRYAANSSQYPENFLPLLGMGFVNLNQVTADLNTRLSIFYHVTMRWKDH